MISENRTTWGNSNNMLYDFISQLMSFLYNIISVFFVPIYELFYAITTILIDILVAILEITLVNPLLTITVIFSFWVINYLWAKFMNRMFPRKRKKYRIKKWIPEEKLITKEDPDFLDFYWEIERG